MSGVDLRKVAEGEIENGYKWVLRIGGSREEYATFLSVAGSDGQWDEGGMTGPALWAGELVNEYFGHLGGRWSMLARTSPSITSLRILAQDESVVVSPIHSDSAVGLNFFVLILPAGKEPPDAIAALGENGKVFTERINREK